MAIREIRGHSPTRSLSNVASPQGRAPARVYAEFQTIGILPPRISVSPPPFPATGPLASDNVSICTTPEDCPARLSVVRFVTSQETSSRLLVWDEMETEVFRGGV